MLGWCETRTTTFPEERHITVREHPSSSVITRIVGPHPTPQKHMLLKRVVAACDRSHFRRRSYLVRDCQRLQADDVCLFQNLVSWWSWFFLVTLNLFPSSCQLFVTFFFFAPHILSLLGTLVFVSHVLHPRLRVLLCVFCSHSAFCVPFTCLFYCQVWSNLVVYNLKKFFLTLADVEDVVSAAVGVG